MVIESAVFSRPVWMYMEDGVIEVNLPEWSGRMDKRYALAELANLKAFIAKVESVLNGPTIRTPRDFTPSARSEVVAEAVAEDEASDSPDLTESEGLDAVESQMWEYVREVAEDTAAEVVAGNEGLADSSELQVFFMRALRTWQRKQAIADGIKPYVPRYRLRRNICTFEGEVYRLIDPRDFNFNDIPF